MLKSVAAIALIAVTAFAAPAAHKIASLPGAPSFAFNMYSGYVNIDAERGKNLFYWFVESQRDPANDPVVLWMNGGPGSSSLLGFFVEHGPFRPNTDGKTLAANPYSWNRVANIIYLEAPAFVGFSYSGNQADLNTGDLPTAVDNYQFILNWLSLYPEYAKNEFYIAGESYGGHYVPDLVMQVITKDVTRRINLVGLLNGNPATNTDWYQTGAVDTSASAWNYLTFLWSHGLLPHDAYGNAYSKCGWERFLSDCSDSWKKPTQECSDAVQICMDYVPEDIDVYDVNADVCLDSQLDYTSKWNSLSRYVKSKRQKAGTLGVSLKHDPCIFDYIVPYLNQPDVQSAIHVKPTMWLPGATNLNYSAEDMHVNKAPLYPEIFRRSNIRTLVFSGDFDAAVPFLETQKWIQCLGRPVKSGWRSWHLDNQVAGGIIEYDKISFLTIKGAGHAVPYYNPRQGFEFFDRWMSKKPF